MTQQYRYVSPPSWPAPPEGWVPPEGWTPPADWGPAPDGWVFWEPVGAVASPNPLTGDAPSPGQGQAEGRSTAAGGAMAWARRHKVLTGVGVLIVIGLVGSAFDSEPATKPVAKTDTVARPEPTPDPTGQPTASPTPVVTAASTKAPTTNQLISAAEPKTALALLGTLLVKGRAPMTGYDRGEFGSAWADTNRNGCDTRNDILKRDLDDRAIKPGTNGCVILSGNLAPDPYTATEIHFVRGGASEVDIDHVVALGNSWATGAFQWADRKRLAFANDPLNLLAVQASANRQKGDGDAATWLPSNKAYRCAYVARQVAVKIKYALWVTMPERDAIAGVLSSCRTQPAPTGGNPTMAPFSSSSGGSTSTSSPKPAVTESTTTSAVKVYANCDEMHQDHPHGVGRPGAADHTSGKPVTNFYVDAELYEANDGRDRDKDGIACEA